VNLVFYIVGIVAFFVAAVVWDRLPSSPIQMIFIGSWVGIGLMAFFAGAVLGRLASIDEKVETLVRRTKPASENRRRD
jgi:hypothetical protein